MLRRLSDRLYLKLLAWDRKRKTGAYRSPNPVISIGNLTLGGTGKTPFCIYLAKKLKEMSERELALATRGYGRSVKEPQLVGTDWTRFGDESVLLKQALPEVQVGCGRHKWQVVEFFDSMKKDWIHLVDDGFQHWALARDLDIVLVDVNERGGELFPFGRFREPLEALERAGIVVFTRCESLRAEQWEELQRNSPVPAEKSVYFKGEFGCDLPSEKKVLLVSGIGAPDSFEKAVGELESYIILDHLRFKDHHSYTRSDYERICAKAKALEVDAILTTSKDQVKLSTWQKSESSVPLFVLDYHTAPCSKKDETLLMAAIAKVLHASV